MCFDLEVGGYSSIVCMSHAFYLEYSQEMEEDGRTGMTCI